jgi:hypothetical protein
LVRGISVATQSCPNTAKFVSRNRSADTAPTDEDSNLGGTLLDRLTYLPGVIGIIIRSRSIMSSKVNNLVAGCPQLGNHAFVKREASVISSNGDSCSHQKLMPAFGVRRLVAVFALARRTYRTLG